MEIKLGDILNNDNYQLQTGDFLVVKTIWAEDIPKEEAEQKRCRFILSDGETFILGVIFLNQGNNPNARNAVRLLQDKSCQWKQLTNFYIDPLEEKHRVFREQNKQLIIRASTLGAISDATGDISNQVGAMLATNFPFEFTHLNVEMDQCSAGTLINIIGFVRKVDKVKTSSGDKPVEYQHITMASSPSKDPNKAGFERVVALFGVSLKRIKNKKVYIILNVQVGEWGVRQEEQNISLRTTTNTIILLVSNLEQLPDQYQRNETIKKLFPQKRRSGRRRNAAPLQSQNLGHPSPPSPSTSATSDDMPYSPGGGSYTEEHPGYFTTALSSAPLAGPSSSNQDENDMPSSSTSPSLIRQPSAQKRGSELQENGSRKLTKYGDLKQFPNKKYDFSKDKPLCVQGNVKFSSQFMDTGDDSYPMRSNPRGIALIINNYVFEGDKNRIRYGNSRDVEYMQDILKAFKFAVHVQNEVEAKDLLRVLTKFKESADKNMDACVVVILSHGAHGLVETVDGKLVPLPNNIIHQFDKTAFPAFAEKPKLFFIQMCQDIPSKNNASHIIENLTPAREGDIDLENMLECYAASSGTKAYRTEALGSFFIYVLVDTLMEHAHETDLDTLLRLIQFRLKHNIKDISLHCGWTAHGFNKTLFFNPGL